MGNIRLHSKYEKRCVVTDPPHLTIADFLTLFLLSPLTTLTLPPLFFTLPPPWCPHITPCTVRRLRHDGVTSVRRLLTCSPRCECIVYCRLVQLWGGKKGGERKERERSKESANILPPSLLGVVLVSISSGGLPGFFSSQHAGWKTGR